MFDGAGVNEFLLEEGTNPSSVGEEIFEDQINYDRNLPGLHKYLGADLVQVTGRTHLEPGMETHMFAFYRPGVILVPGQSLPLIPYSSFESGLLQRISREKLPLIFLPGCFDFTALEDLIECVGTTADLVAIRIPGEGEEDTIHAIFVGRQRIRITRVTRDETYPLVCYGIILPECSINQQMASNPLGWGLLPRGWSRFGNDPRPARLKSAAADSVTDAPSPGHTAKSGRGRQSRRSEDSFSSSSSSNLNCQMPSGNPLSIFDSRLSTWRHFGPVSSGCLPSPSSSPNSRLDHFVDDTVEKQEQRQVQQIRQQDDCSVSSVHASAPDLSSPKTADNLLKEDSVEKPTRTLPKIIEPSEPQQISYSEGCVPVNSVNLDPNVVTEDVELIMDRAVDRVGRPFRYRIRQPCHPRLLARRDILAAAAQSFVPYPFWVYRQYDVSYLVTAIQTELLSWNDTWNVHKFRPELAVPFSFWLVQNLPMPGQLKAYLLGINHVVQRLRALLDIIRRSSSCVCGMCDSQITSNRYIVCLAQEGSFQTYVNPAGILHDMVTVSQVVDSSVTSIGSPSSEYSWFPGYSWTITNCSRCSQHLGWLFTADKDELRPRRFWGIRRDSIVPGSINEAEWRPCT